MKKHPNYPTIPGLCLAAKLFFLSIPRFLIFLSSSLQSSLLQSSIWLSSFCDDRNTHNIRNQSCLGRFDINCTEHCYSEHRVAWLTNLAQKRFEQFSCCSGDYGMEHYVAHLESLYIGNFYYCLEQILDPIEEKIVLTFFISIRLGSVNSPLFSS